MQVINPQNITDCRNFIAQHRNSIAKQEYDIAIKSQWVKDIDLEDRILLAKNCPTAKTVLAETDNHLDVLHILARDVNDIVRRKVAANHYTSVNILTSLARDSDVYVKSGVAHNLSTPISVLEFLADDNAEVASQLIYNPNTPLRLLVKIWDSGKSSNTRLRDRIDELIASPNTPLEDLMFMARCNTSYLKVDLACSPNLPASVLAVLARDPDTKEDVARNSQTPVNILDILAQDPDQKVRKNVASNPNTPIATLDILAKDTSKDVREKVANNPNTSATTMAFILARDNHPKAIEMASNPNTPANILDIFIKHGDVNITKAVVNNPSVDLYCFEAFATPNFLSSGHKEIKVAVAQNPKTPAAILDKLNQVNDRDVRLAVQNNPNFNHQQPNMRLQEVKSQTELDTVVKEYETQGYRVINRSDKFALVKKLSNGTLTGHAICFLFTSWWTCGLGNLFYLIYANSNLSSSVKIVFK